jgi:hypothetical protein
MKLFLQHKPLLTAAVAALVLASCKKQLDLRPTDVIDEVKAFQSVGDLRKGLNGVYSQVGAGLVNGIYLAAIPSDETRVSIGENAGAGLFTFRWQYTSAAVGNDASGDYATFYRAIDRAHRVLDAMENITAGSPAEEAEKRRIQAELIAFRGISHYELLKRWMPAGYDPSALGVPVVLRSDLLQKPGRNTVGEVLSQVEQDLNAAFNSPEIPAGTTDVYRISKAAIVAYQARIALLKRDWTRAATLADQAITLSGKSVAGRSEYPAIWRDQTNSEIILKFDNNYAIASLWRSTAGTVDYEPSMKLKSQYNRSTDIRFSTFFGSAGNDTSIVVKYPGNSTGPANNHLKAIRVSEMVLIRAEANAELDQLLQSAQDVNLIRRNRITGYADVNFGSRDEAITAILDERYKELAFEGFRFFDLKRRSLPVQRLTADVQSGAWQTLPAGNFRFAFAVPASEIFANPATVQNPGY